MTIKYQQTMYCCKIAKSAPVYYDNGKDPMRNGDDYEPGYYFYDHEYDDRAFDERFNFCPWCGNKI